jgi:hypothetical protein
MNEKWVISLRDQCALAEVPFFFKQWGGVRKSEHGRELDGRTYDAMPEREIRAAPPHRIRQRMLDESKKWETALDEPSPINQIMLKPQLLF